MTNLGDLSKVWIYGNGGFAQSVKEFLTTQNIQIIGNITQNGFCMDGIEGDSSLYQNNKYPVVIGVFNHRDNPVEIVEFLETLRVDVIITPALLMSQFKGMGFNQYYLDTDVDSEEIRDQTTQLIAALSDDESKRVLEGFLNYRETGDARAIIRSGTASDQYLGKTLPTRFKEEWLRGPLKWFDIGSYDGDTLRAIRDSGRDTQMDSFLCVEPDQINFDKLGETAKEIDASVKLLNVAIGQKTGFVDFVHEGTLSARESQAQSSNLATSSVKVMTIDEICEDFKPTHIKMDIEGAELGALLGGIKSIQKIRPKIAVSLYHKPMDVIELSQILLNNLNNYSWFIRCYGAHGYDTILYGVPN